MFLRDLSASLLRRWYLVVIGLVLTAGACLGSFKVVLPTYQMQASVLLLPPKSSVGTTGNPYLYLGGLSQALDVLTRSMTAEDEQKAILGTTSTASYVVAQDVTTSGPIILVTVTGPESAAVTSTLSSVLAAIPTKLADLQNQLSVPENSRIGQMPLSVDEHPTAVRKTQLRAVLAVGALGVVLTVLLAGLVDGIATRRRLRREAMAAADSDLPLPDAPVRAGLGNRRPSTGPRRDRLRPREQQPVPVGRTNEPVDERVNR